MRARAALILALVLSTAACGVAAPRPATGPAAPAPAGPIAPAPTPPAAAQSRPTASWVTFPTLPNPVAIPADGYAPEPIVEYGSIEIPRIGLVHTLFEGVTLHNIDRGPSHWTGTAAPGERGNAVFAGHRVTFTEPFRRIDELEPGDEVTFRVNGRTSTYRVTGSVIVEPQAVWIGTQTPEPTATLYACHPPGSVDQRYVVQLALVA